VRFIAEKTDSDPHAIAAGLVAITSSVSAAVVLEMLSK
jgi:hypothetical protein